MPLILIPSRAAEDWRQFLADQSHWRIGYSARSLAHCWHEAAGFPPAVSQALSTTPALAGAEMLRAIHEHQVPLPGGGRPSQNDLWVLARSETGLLSITVEGKVSEPFGPTVGEWLVSWRKTHGPGGYANCPAGWKNLLSYTYSSGKLLE